MLWVEGIAWADTWERRMQRELAHDSLSLTLLTSAHPRRCRMSMRLFSFHVCTFLHTGEPQTASKIMMAAVIRRNKGNCVCVCEWESIASTEQRVMSITEEHPTPYLQCVSSLVGVMRYRAWWQVHWWGLNGFSHGHTSSFTFCAHSYTHTQTIWCFCMSPLVAKEMGFSLTSRSVSLQHVTMATENLLKGLTALLVFRRKGFFVTVFADLNWSRECMCCAWFRVQLLYLPDAECWRVSFFECTF